MALLADLDGYVVEVSAPIRRWSRFHVGIERPVQTGLNFAPYRTTSSSA